MKHLFERLRGVFIAFAALALSAGLAFGAQPEAPLPGLANASTHAGKTVPVKAGQQDESTDEDTDEDLGEDEDTEESLDEEGAEDGTGGENCSTDPTTLTEEELAELKHGSIVCWAAHQDEELWGAEFANHGQWVKSWAQSGKDDETTDEDAGATSAGNGHGKGQGQGKGHNK